jgi:hypothetical protein
MHFQTSGHLPALRDLIYPIDFWITWRSTDSSELRSRKDFGIS